MNNASTFCVAPYYMIEVSMNVSGLRATERFYMATLYVRNYQVEQ